MSHPLIASDPKCVQMLEGALSYHSLSYEKKMDFWSGKVRPSRWPKLLAALSYADKMIECYDFEEQQWMTLTEKPSATFGAEMIYLNGKLYTLGGVQSKVVDQFDLESGKWVEHFPSLTRFRVAHGVCTLKDRILVIGGSAKSGCDDFGQGLNDMEIMLEKGM